MKTLRRARAWYEEEQEKANVTSVLSKKGKYTEIREERSAGSHLQGLGEDLALALVEVQAGQLQTAEYPDLICILKKFLWPRCEAHWGVARVPVGR